MRLRFPRIRTSGLQRYLGEGEQVLRTTRQHPFALVGAAVDALGLIVPLAVAAWGIAGIGALPDALVAWLLRAAFVVMFALVARLAWRVLGWEFERVVVTDEKVIHVSGVLARRIASTPLAKVSEFTVRQPLLGRVLDYGSLVVDVPGGRDDALHGLAYLPDPTGLYRLVSDQARHGRTKEGGGALLRAPVPTDQDLERIARQVPSRPDPWQPVLDAADADHTIRIPVVPPGD